MLGKCPCSYLRFLNKSRAHCVLDSQPTAKNVNFAVDSQQIYFLEINSHNFNGDKTIPVKVKDVFRHPRYVEDRS